MRQELADRESTQIEVMSNRPPQPPAAIAFGESVLPTATWNNGVMLVNMMLINSEVTEPTELSLSEYNILTR